MAKRHKNPAAWERMERLYEPGMGRILLSRVAMATENEAKAFLMGKVEAGIAPTHNRVAQAPPNFMDQLHPHEQRLILQGLSAPPPVPPTEITWSKTSIKFAAIGDSHIGHTMAHQSWWDVMCHKLDAEKVDFALHTGDITEGMSGRDGHVYELEAIGVTAQLELAERRIKQVPCPVRGISGNHDLWGFKTIGFDPGLELGKRVEHFEYLGQNECTLDIGGLKVMLSHPGDGSSYATSYASQKFVESLTGGEKPHILLMGHHHKSIFHVCRNVHVFETGTLCGQTGWMRGKKLAAHTGFWIVEVWPNATGVERIRSEWVPLYSK